MKLKFKIECTDKYTNETYEKGKTYEFKEERAKEILETGYVDEVKEEPVEEGKKTKGKKK